MRLKCDSSPSRRLEFPSLETGDIILLNESLRFIQNVASCYALCLTKESVNTATLVHAPACVCVFVCVCVGACVCATHGGLSDTSALEIRSRSGSGFNSLPVRSPDFEKCWAIPLSACWSRFVSLVSERICGVRCQKLRHYSVIPFLLSLSVYSELTAIKTFTGINLGQSLHVLQTLVQTRACLISISSPSWFKTEYFQHCDVTNCPAPRIENIPNRDTTVSYRTEPWILWTVTPPNIYIYIYIYLNIYVLKEINTFIQQESIK